MRHTHLDPRDLDFLLYEVMEAESLAERARFAGLGRETFDAIVVTARRIALDHFATHHRASDVHEPRLENGRVVIIPEVKAALRAMSEAGFLAATHDAAIGGMQLPHVVATAAIAWFESANVATASYALLTTGAANLIAKFGSPEQKAAFLPSMFEGRFFGTMALTEPDAGSSLADVRTAAEPIGDGRHHLTGTKIWISAGEHELSKNIVHLVLARVRGAPEGVRGISLFIVPRYHVGADGMIGAPNGVTLGGLIHKMGWRGTTSTILNFGEGERCVGWMVGEANRGLGYMFHMMNEARIAVGRAATAMGYAAYLYSLDYARTRRQGRLPGEKDPARPPVAIIEHPDVRRMLLSQKATVEGAMALILQCARLVDDAETAPDESERREAALLLEVLTPIAKAWPSEACQESISLAVQVLGGYGYAREYPVEQYYRDNRLNQIHEGTNGIQALDLLGRKVRQEGGAAFVALARRIAATAEEGRAAGGDVAPLAESLGAGLARLVAATEALAAAAERTEPARALANASVYLDMASRTVVAWLWVRQAIAAARLLASGTGDQRFLRGKLQAARFYVRWELPKTVAQGDLLRQLDATPYEMEDGWF